MISSFNKYLILIATFVLSLNVYAALKTEDLVNLIQPATLPITVLGKGEIFTPNFVFDLEKNTFSTTTKINGFSTTSIEIDNKGNGFFISDDGLLITDYYFIFNKIDNVYKSATEKYLQDKNIKQEDSSYSKAYESVFNYIIENSVKDFELNIKVLTPTNTYKAEIINATSSLSQQENIALLKIDAKNTPSVYLSDTSSGIGETLYSIGYLPPEKTVSEVVFNQGVINSIKDGQFQTDLALFDAGVGSPIFDQNAMVLGIVSSSGSVISSTNIKQILLSKDILVKQSVYFDSYTKGSIFLENKQCKKSIAEFNKLKTINPDFSVEKYIQIKIDKCNDLIASGQSIDNFWSQVLFTIKNNPYSSYLLFSVIILFILYIILYKYFVNRFRCDEDKIKSILGPEVAGDDDKGNDDEGIVFEEPVPKNKTKTSIDPQISEDFKYEVFEPVEKQILQTPVLKSNLQHMEKVEIPEKPEEAKSIVTPPKAIQPDAPIVVITPFKTLNKPIKSISNSPVEMMKDIKTDLPAKKKEDTI